MTTHPPKNKKASSSLFSSLIVKPLVFLCGIGACLLLLGVLAVVLVWPNLPDLKAMTDYRPRMPLRIFSADKVLLAEYGDERRNVLNLKEMPTVLKQAVLAAEDDNFYDHGGVDWSGVGRAVLTNITTGAKAQGASTITMQVARNFYLSSQKTFIRKFYELLLTYKIEQNLTKDQILELYMNQIYLGHRSYGFAAASRTYFNKPLAEVSLAEAAILASIPKSPSRGNPRTNLSRSIARQHYVLDRMLKLNYINQVQYDQAIAEKIVVTKNSVTDSDEKKTAREGKYVAELARQLMYNTYGDNVYGRGLNVYTTVESKDQNAAYTAVRNGLLNYTRRKPYSGPAAQFDLPAGIENYPDKITDIMAEVHEKHPDSDAIVAVLVLSASASKVEVMRDPGQIIELSGDALKNARRSLAANVSESRRIKRGSVIYIEPSRNNGWSIINLPLIQGAFVSLNPNNGAIESMIGGFDFNFGDFNRVTQAWRQPGSTFKPFIYAAGLERGITPETVVSDQPFYLPASKTGSKPWQPKNYGNSYTPSQTMRQGLYKSKNMVSIRILEAVGPDFSRSFIERIGFDLKRQPPAGAYLTMALGAGSVTPLQMAAAYSVFANGGYHIDPYIIDHVVDTNGVTIMKAQPLLAGDEKNRVMDSRTAYVMNDVLRGVATSGTAARASATLKRRDIGGKTGTTNRSFDAWFVGFTPRLVGVAWLGFDQPTSLGDRETGGGAAMPIWMNYMSSALKDVPVIGPGPMPKGLSRSNGNFYFSEFPLGKAISNIGAGAELPGAVPVSGGGGDAIGDLIQSFNPTGGPPIRF